MSDVNRLRKAKGEYRAAPASGTVIEAGDMVAYNSGSPIPASDQTFDTDEATTTANFADDFGGVAMMASADGETDEITIVYEGVFEYPTEASATFNVFDLIAPAFDGGNSVLFDQQVEAAATNSEAIAQCVREYSSNTDAVLIELLPILARQSVL